MGAKMLGMLWSTPHLDDRAKARLKNRIANLLHEQLSIVPDAAIEDSSGDLNRKAIGYVYGYVNAYLKARFDLEPSHICVAVTSEILEVLFPRHESAEYSQFLMRNLNDRLVVSGKKAGNREFQDYLDNRNAVPVGLARIIVEGERVDA
jgi:hypothetical protein